MNTQVFGVLLAVGCAGIVLSFTQGRWRAVLLQDGFSTRNRRSTAVALLGAVLLLTVVIPFAGGLAGGAPETKNLTIVSLFAVHLILIAFLALYYLLSGRRPLAEFLHLQSARPAADLSSGILIGLAGWLLTIVAVVGIVFVWLLFHPAALSGMGARQVNPTVLWIVSRPLAIRIAIVVSAMVVEELFFRSFLQTRVGPVAATLMFTAAHGVYGQPLVLIGIFVISAVLSATFLIYGNVLPCIVAHGTFDAIQMFVLIPLALKGMSAGG
jgi:membrane protease YdiL (CAAX protease family)